MAKQKLITIAENFRLTLLVLAFTLPLLAFFSQQASAGTTGNDTTSSQDSLDRYCATLKLSNAAEQSCKDNISAARHVATYHCSNDDTSKTPAACVQGTARGYLKDAALSSPKPKTAAQYKKAIDKVLDKAGGSTRVDAPGFGSLEQDGASAATTTPCAVGSTECSDPAANPSSKCGNDDCDFIRKFINPAINTLSACFGIVAIISVILGGINYSTSEGDPQKVSRAKNRILNTIVAVIAYLFLWSFLQFLVPGGAFK